MSVVHIAEKLSPYLYVIWTGLLILVASTVLLGIFLVLKHAFAKNSFEGNSEYDKLKIAREINEDIMKLTDLRNRLDPSFLVAAQSLAGTQDLAARIQQPIPVAETTAGPLGDEEKKALEAALEAKYKDEISKLKEELEKMKAQPSAALEGASAEGSSAKVQEALDKQKSQLGEETEKLKAQVGHLEKVLSEYRIFEDDFAFVKKLKAENADLREQLEKLLAGGAGAAGVVAAVESSIVESSVAAPVTTSAENVAPEVPVTASVPPTGVTAEQPISAPEATFSEAGVVSEVTEDDIANLFQELKGPEGEESTKTTPQSSPAPGTQVVMDPASKESVSVSPAEENKMVADEETAEALAETDSDELMAQFEKLLSEGQKA